MEELDDWLRRIHMAPNIGLGIETVQACFIFDDMQWAFKLSTLLQSVPNLSWLVLDILGMRQLPARALENIYLPRLTDLSVENISHDALTTILHNNPNIWTLSIGSTVCQGSYCTLRDVRFTHPISVSGGSPCLISLLHNNIIGGMSLSIRIRSIAATARTRLAIRFMTSLSIQYESTHGDILKTIADICPDLVYLELKMKSFLTVSHSSCQRPILISPSC